MLRAGRVIISGELLCEILDFKGAIVCGVNLGTHNKILLILEHPDLPEVSNREAIPVVMPTYVTTYGENGVPLKIERIDPPKEER